MSNRPSDTVQAYHGSVGGLGDEVDEFLDPADEGRLEVVPVTHLAADPPPRLGDVGLLGVRPAECGTDAVLPIRSARYHRPGLQPQSRRLDRLPDVDVRVADDQGVGATRSALHGVGDAGLLRAGDQVVDEDAEPATRPGLKLRDDGGEVVDAAEVLDHDALHPKVLTPYLFDEFGVVASLDVDTAGQRHLGAPAGHRHRARRRAGRRGGRLSPRRVDDHRLAVDEVAGADREGLPAAVAVLELHPPVLDGDDRAHVTG